jgi:hypothetical protein
MKSRVISTIRTQVGGLSLVSSSCHCVGQGADTVDVENKKKPFEFILPKTVPVPGFAAALRKLHALGHPLHIVTARPEDCRAQVIGWLAEHGIGVGFGDNDVVAAVWFTHGFALPTSPGGANGAVQEVGNKQLDVEVQAMFKASVGQGSTGNKKLKVCCITAANLHAKTNRHRS